MGKLRPREGRPGPGSDRSWGTALANTQVSPPVGTLGERQDWRGLLPFLRAHLGLEEGLWQLPTGIPGRVQCGWGGRGLLLTESLILRQKIGCVVIHVLNGDEEAP